MHGAIPVVMTAVLFDKIPSLDLANFTKGTKSDRSKFVLDLGQAFNNIGFVAIRNHFLSESLTKQLYEVVKIFFDLKDKTKRKYEIPHLAGQRGYVSKGRERAKGRNVGDLKEFYHIGQEVIAYDPIKEEYPDNIWPEEVPTFKTIGSEVYRKLKLANLQDDC